MKTEYIDGTKPQRGDRVVGTAAGKPCAGTVVRVGADGSVTVRRLGPAGFDPASKQRYQGREETVEAPAEDLELVYRHQQKEA